jgi:HD-GYP domain-containing protein (c-di-GMP phosphodiesterase class II)
VQEAAVQDVAQDAAAPSLSAERLKIFLFFTHADITNLLSLALDSYFQCEVKSFPTAAEAATALQKEKPHLLVADTHREDSSSVLEAAKAAQCKVAAYHQKKQAITIKGLDVAGVFSEPELLQGVSQALKQMGGVAKNTAMADADPTYPFFRVGIPLLLKTDPLVSDVFIKLSELKYVKLFHKGASFGQEEVQKYHGQKKIEYFYVRREEAEQITGKVNDTLEKLLAMNTLPQEVSSPASVTAIDTMHSLVNQVGFTPEVQKLVKNNVDVVLKEMYASPSLDAILKNMHLGKDKYIAAHSHMLAEVACALSIAMKWDSETTFKKLTMGALLHDMAITNQKLAKIKDLKELEERRSEFKLAEIEEYKSHSKRALILVKGMKELPADVDKIIGQHHEMPMGTGFPDGLTHVHIHPLASLMMVAHDLVDWVMDHPAGNPDVVGFIEAHAEKFKAGNFKKLLKALYALQDVV